MPHDYDRATKSHYQKLLSFSKSAYEEYRYQLFGLEALTQEDVDLIRADSELFDGERR